MKLRAIALATLLLLLAAPVVQARGLAADGSGRAVPASHMDGSRFLAEDWSQLALFTGRKVTTANKQEKGASALFSFDVSHTFLHAGAWPLVPPFNNGSSAWVGIVPGTGNPQYGNSNAVVQIGVVDCDSGLYSACLGNDPRLFIAWGGCNGVKPEARTDLGVAPFDQGEWWLKFKVTRFSQKVKFRLDWSDGQEYVWTYEVWNTDPDFADFACWIDGNTDVQYLFEKKDRADSVGWWDCGTSCAAGFWQLQKYANGVWEPLSTVSCDVRNALNPYHEVCLAWNNSILYVGTDEDATP